MENKFNNQGSVHIGNQIDNTNNQGQINIANDNATINATQNIDNRSLSGIDMKQLDKELNDLEIKLAEGKMYVEAEAVKNAVEAKEENEKIGFLKRAGTKALEIAQEISLPIATTALSKVLGLEL